MFVLHTMHERVKVPAHLLASTTEAIHREIDMKYPNRVLPNVGLVVCRYGDLESVEPGLCIHGNVLHPCSFTLIVFRPFVEEVVTGTILASNADGIQVSLGFFKDVYIPAYWMLNPSTYSEEKKIWIWNPDLDEEDGDENGAKTETADDSQLAEYEMFSGAEIRFKVKAVHFAQMTKTAKGMHASLSSDNTTRKRSESIGLYEETTPPPPMHIVASICEDGLGLTGWWQQAQADDEEPENVEDAEETLV